MDKIVILFTTLKVLKYSQFYIVKRLGNNVRNQAWKPS